MFRKCFKIIKFRLAENSYPQVLSGAVDNSKKLLFLELASRRADIQIPCHRKYPQAAALTAKVCPGRRNAQKGS